MPFNLRYENEDSISERVNDSEITPYKKVSNQQSPIIKEKLRQLAFDQWETEKQKFEKIHDWDPDNSTYQ